MVESYCGSSDFYDFNTTFNLLLNHVDPSINIAFSTDLDDGEDDELIFYFFK